MSEVWENAIHGYTRGKNCNKFHPRLCYACGQENCEFMHLKTLEKARQSLNKMIVNANKQSLILWSKNHTTQLWLKADQAAIEFSLGQAGIRGSKNASKQIHGDCAVCSPAQPQLTDSLASEPMGGCSSNDEQRKASWLRPSSSPLRTLIENISGILLKKLGKNML